MLHTDQIDWESLTCRHGDKNLVVALCHIPQGCWCWSDPVQALCLQHLMSAQSNGPIVILATRLEPDNPTQDREQKP
jgi:hypothetical protein